MMVRMSGRAVVRVGLLGRTRAEACPNLPQRRSGPGSAARRIAEYQRFSSSAPARSGPLQQIWTNSAAAGSDGDHKQVPRRALRTRKCSSNRHSRVQNAPLESEMHISTSRGPAITSWASAAPAPPRSISGDPVRRGAAILISSEAVVRRSGSARSWAGVDPSPACAMRAQRNEIHLGSHHASSARQIRLRSIRASPPRTMRSQVTSPKRLPPGRVRTASPGRAPGSHAPWEGVRSSAPWLPVPCVRTGSQPRRGATVEVAPPRER